MSDGRGKVRTVQAVDRAFAIMDALAGHPEGLTLSDLASELALAPQTVQSLVRTLQVHGLAAQPGKGMPYFLGPMIHQLSRRWLAGDGTAVLARGVVTRLAREIQEYVLLAELRGETLFPLCELRGNQALAANPWHGDKWYRMATGKLLLAHCSADEQKRIVERLGEVDNPEAYMAELQAIAAAGQVVCRERLEGLSAIAVPVRDVAGETSLALGVAVPSVRLTVEFERELLVRLKGAAAELEGLWSL